MWAVAKRSTRSIGLGGCPDRGRENQVVAPNIQHNGAQVIDCSGWSSCPASWTPIGTCGRDCCETSAPTISSSTTSTRSCFGFAPKLTPDDVYLGNLITALSAMNAGITTILDWSHINTTPQHAGVAIRALRDGGIRAVYAYGPNFGVPPWYDNLDRPIRATSTASGTSISPPPTSC